jgi:hypothetical protein
MLYGTVDGSIMITEVAFHDLPVHPISDVLFTDGWL